MKSVHQLVVYLALLLPVGANAGSIIKCESADGSITFADTRCPAGQTQLSKKSYQQRKLEKQTSRKSVEKAAEFPDDGSRPVMDNYVFMAKLSKVLSSVTMLKIKMSEYMNYHGRWPENLQDMNYRAEEMISTLITETSLSTEGRVNVRLSEEFGKNKGIWIYPEMVMGGEHIEWQCYANFPAAQLSTGTGVAVCQSRYF